MCMCQAVSSSVDAGVVRVDMEVFVGGVSAQVHKTVMVHQVHPQELPGGLAGS